jgi:hypothetical protein
MCSGFKTAPRIEPERHLAQEAPAAWAQARPRNAGSRPALCHAHTNTAGLHASAAMGLSGRLLFDSSNYGELTTHLCYVLPPPPRRPH